MVRVLWSLVVAQMSSTQASSTQASSTQAAEPPDPIADMLLLPAGICLAFVQHLYNAECSVLIYDLALHREAIAWLDTIQNHGSANESHHAGWCSKKTDVSDWKQLHRPFGVYDGKFGCVPYILCPGAGIYEPLRMSLEPVICQYRCSPRG